MQIVIEDGWGGSLIATIPDGTKSITVNVDNLDNLGVIVRNMEGNDTLLIMEDYSK